MTSQSDNTLGPNQASEAHTDESQAAAADSAKQAEKATVDHGDANKLLKELSAAEDKAEFHKFEGQLKDEPFLSREQKKLFEQIKSDISDTREFDKAEVPSIFDSFKPTEYHISPAELDGKPFDQSDIPLDTSAVVPLSDVVSAADARSKEDQKNEFNNTSGLLASDEFHPTGEDAQSEQAAREAAQDEVNALDTAQVIDADHTPLNLYADAPQLQPRQPKGLLDRLHNWITNDPQNYRVGPTNTIEFSKRPIEDFYIASSGMPFYEAAGVSCLGILVASIIFLPPQLKNGVLDEADARSHLRAALHEDLGKDSMQEKKRMQQAGPVNTAPPITHYPDEPAPVVIAQKKADAAAELAALEADMQGMKPMGNRKDVFVSVLGQHLMFARSLVTKGMLAQAIPYFERYVKKSPDSIKPRFELISIYLKTHDRKKARELCLTTFKQDLDSQEISELWGLFSQCQTDS